MNKVTGNREGVQDLGRAIARLHQVDAAGRDRRN
jgi:aminoglycoside phosphotransferase (APT) family kinase protein